MLRGKHCESVVNLIIIERKIQKICNINTHTINTHINLTKETTLIFKIIKNKQAYRYIFEIAQIKLLSKMLNFQYIFFYFQHQISLYFC